jgi:hypothetical protein
MQVESKGKEKMDKPLLVDFERGSALLSVSVPSLRGWAKKGILKTVLVCRRRLIPMSELERIAAQGLERS